MTFGDHSVWVWIVFNVLMLGLIAFDLGILHKERRAIPVREALYTTLFYISLALAFNAWIYYQYGSGKALEFLTGYFIEYALSMDNIMVFVVIMAHFHVPPQYQMRVLQWGIIAALILRAIFIFVGVALIEAFEWVVLILGAFLIYTGIKSLTTEEGPSDLDENRVVAYVRRFLPVTQTYQGDKFFVRDHGKLFATPMFLVLVVLNITDIMFAVDSIPAVFAITRDPFIVYTSNVFAVLGLRALYFALAGMLDKFRYLKIGLSLVLIFIGFKMVFNYPSSLPDIPTVWALIITAILIFGSIILSLIRADKNDKKDDVVRTL
jgi:tellurite resistance protein TerC